jgi:hypothetical protein
MTWLSMAAKIALTAARIVVGFGPAASALIPGTKDDKIIAVGTDYLVKISNVIQNAELFGQALGIKGPDKLKAAAPAVAQIVLTSSLVAGKKIANPALFQQGCTKVGDGVADILNSLSAGDVETRDN